MICARCDLPIEEGQLYHYALRANPAIETGNFRSVFDLDLPVHEAPCPPKMEIVNGHLMIAGVDMGDFSELGVTDRVLYPSTETAL